VGDGEAGSEDGVTLDTYSHVLPGMQQKAVNAITELLTSEVNKEQNRSIIGSRKSNSYQEWRGGL
jgi:hypothetical protein